MDAKARETITKYLGDMHALESHGLQPIGHQVDQLKGMDHPEARRSVLDFKQTTERHIMALEQRLKALGGSPSSPIKDAAASVAGMAAGLYNAVRNEQAAKSIRDDYTFFSNCSIAYLMLLTTARAFGDQETAQLAEQHYRDEARMVMVIDQIMPTLVVQEFKQDGLPAQDPSQEVQRIVHDAWTRQ